MPHYAILGATGATGQQILTLLSRSLDTHINVYVRSRAKLVQQLPPLASRPNIHVFEGPLHDIDLILRCIANTNAVFGATGINSNPKGCSIAQDTARVLVEALQQIRDDNKNAPLPRLIMLSSISVNPTFEKRQTGLFFWFLHTALCNAYGDLRLAEKLLREHEEWLKVVFVTPGVLSSDPVQRGHSLSVSEEGSGFLSYVDLAAGMIEVAEEEGGRYDWKGVVVQPRVSPPPPPRHAPPPLVVQPRVSAKFDFQAPRNLVVGFWQTLVQRIF